MGVLGAMSLAAACGDSEAPAKPAVGGGGGDGDGPEVTKLRIGIIALTDCSPIVIAHEKGFFAKHGIQSIG